MSTPQIFYAAFLHHQAILNLVLSALSALISNTIIPFCRPCHAPQGLCYLSATPSNFYVSVKPIVRRIDPDPNHFLPILKGKHSLLYQLRHDLR